MSDKLQRRSGHSLSAPDWQRGFETATTAFTLSKETRVDCYLPSFRFTLAEPLCFLMDFHCVSVILQYISYIFSAYASVIMIRQHTTAAGYLAG